MKRTTLFSVKIVLMVLTLSWAVLLVGCDEDDNGEDSGLDGDYEVNINDSGDDDDDDDDLSDGDTDTDGDAGDDDDDVEPPVNECTNGTAQCHANANCYDTEESYECRCKSGYVGDGVDACDDIDECASGTDNCHANAECANTEGSFECTCPAGFEGDGYATCADINECANETDNCAEGARCTNTPGGFECHCPTGYEGDPTVACTDIDECTTETDNCHPTAVCTNMDGGFECSCPEGYEGTGLAGCYLPNECANGTAQCGDNADCVNTDEGYDCVCPTGFEGDPTVACTDINECDAQRGEYPCFDNAICTNVPGSYTCACPEGYEGDGVNACANIDECALETSPCADNAECYDLPGNFRCECPEGYEGDGYESCENINECQQDPSPCLDMATCEDTPGSFTCTCPDGYEGNGIYFCNNVDECTLGTDDCSDDSTCVDTEGSFECHCPDGYEYDGSACVDIDECTVGEFPCAENADCENTDGGFTCTCVEGYEGDDPETLCENIDECARDLDDCDELHGSCEDTDGSFSCSCNAGYEFVEDSHACVNIDECAENSDDCGTLATCEDTEGSYLCNCPDHYYGDGLDCYDIDECAWGWDDCHPNADCTNTEGGFTCACSEGFEGDGYECVDINECDAQQSLCSDYEECVNTIGSYECTCPEGTFSDGNGRCFVLMGINNELGGDPSGMTRTTARQYYWNPEDNDFDEVDFTEMGYRNTNWTQYVFGMAFDPDTESLIYGAYEHNISIAGEDPQFHFFRLDVDLVALDQAGTSVETEKTPYAFTITPEGEWLIIADGGEGTLGLYSVTWGSDGTNQWLNWTLERELDLPLDPTTSLQMVYDTRENAPALVYGQMDDSDLFTIYYQHLLDNDQLGTPIQLVSEEGYGHYINKIQGATFEWEQNAVALSVSNRYDDDILIDIYSATDGAWLVQADSAYSTDMVALGFGPLPSACHAENPCEVGQVCSHGPWGTDCGCLPGYFMNPNTGECQSGAYPGVGELLITEVMMDGENTSWFEVKNLTDNALNLNGTTFSNQGYGSSERINEDLILGPHDLMVFGYSDDPLLNGGITPDYLFTGFDHTYSEYGFCITNFDGEQVSCLSYEEMESLWGAFFSGVSIQLNPGFEDPMYQENDDYWCAARTPYGEDGLLGTPGTDNPPCISLDWCRLQWPVDEELIHGNSVQVYGRFYSQGFTDQTPFTEDAKALLIAQVGVGPDGSDPSQDASSWTWTDAHANTGYIGELSGEPNNDEYMGMLTTPNELGSFDFAYRFSGDNGQTWLVCDRNTGLEGEDGSANGYQVENAGSLTVNGCQSDEDCLALNEACYTGYCLPSECRADQFEANNTINEAAPIAMDWYPSLSICGDDEDWFQFDPGTYSTVRITLTYTPEQGIVGFALYSAQDPEVPLELSYTQSGQEVIEFFVDDIFEGDTFYLNVYSESDDNAMDYSLQFDVSQVF